MKRFALGTLIIALSIGYLGAQERGRSLFVDHSDTGETVHVLPSQAAVHSPHDTQPTIASVALLRRNSRRDQSGMFESNVSGRSEAELNPPFCYPRGRLM